MEEDQAKLFISKSKQNIDDYIRKNEYRQAFRLFIMVLERLNDAEKVDLIDYYSKNMLQLGSFSHLEPNYKEGI